MWSGLNWLIGLGYCLFLSSCKDCSRPSGYIKGNKSLDYLSHFQFLKYVFHGVRLDVRNSVRTTVFACVSPKLTSLFCVINGNASCQHITV
jgi:hypothetical protein